jgi:hypothetical protein
VHWLIAAQMNIQRPDPDDDADDEPSGAAASVDQLAALGGVAPQLQASAHVREAVSNASNDLEVLSILERMHFGEVKNVREL